MSRIAGVCGLCNCECGLIATVSQGRVIELRGDPGCILNRGALCAKGLVQGGLAYDPDRVLKPQRRTKSGRWESVDWTTALVDISTKLTELKEKYGPASLALYQGTLAKPNNSWISNDFLHAWGSPNFTSTYSLCISPREIAGEAVFGQGRVPLGDFREAKYILLLGANPAATGMHRYLRLTDDILLAKEKGAKLVVVDPRLTETARLADQWVSIRPGADLAFVLGLIHVIIKENLHDPDFIDTYTHGFDRVRREAETFSPGVVAELTGVTAETLGAIARAFATTKPALVDRRQGVMHQKEATRINRAVLALAAICGQVDVKGGLIFPPRLPPLLAPRPAPPGTPPFTQGRSAISNAPAHLPQAILSEEPYPIKALITVMGNPVTAWPSTQRVLAALTRLELIVVIDLYLNETARQAHYFLPGVTGLERTFLAMTNQVPLSLVRVNRPALHPLGQARPEDEIILALGQKLGLGGFESLRSSSDIIDHMLIPSGLTTAGLAASPQGVIFAESRVGELRRPGSANSKINLMPLDLAAPPQQDAPSPGESCFPYHLVAGFRLPFHYHSSLNNLPHLLPFYPLHHAQIAADVAARSGIRDGDLVEIKTSEGSLKLTAKIMEESCPGLVAVPHGFGGRHGQVVRKLDGVNVNFLTAEDFDPYSAIPAYRQIRCQVTRLPTPGFLRLKAERCVGCRACEVACGGKNGLSPGLSLLRIDYGRGLPRMTVCRQCAKPRCVSSCRFGAWEKVAGLWLVLPEKCTGCGACQDACPYQAVIRETRTNQARKCSLCQGAAPTGENDPSCIRACPMNALYLD